MSFLCNEKSGSARNADEKKSEVIQNSMNPDDCIESRKEECLPVRYVTNERLYEEMMKVSRQISAFNSMQALFSGLAGACLVAGIIFLCVLFASV